MAKSNNQSFSLGDAFQLVSKLNDKWMQIISQENTTAWSKYLDSAVDSQLDFMDKTWGNIQRNLDPFFLKLPSNYNKILKAQEASQKGQMAKRIWNSDYGDIEKKNAKWNDSRKSAIDAAIGAIPIIGDIWNLGDRIATLLHNRGQIADDDYRNALVPLLIKEKQLEKDVMSGQGKFDDKLLLTYQMRAAFWSKMLKSFEWDEGNKYYEMDRSEFEQVLLDIERQKSKMADKTGFVQFADRPLKPEKKFYDQLQTIRDSFLMSGKTQSDYDTYKKGIQNSTAKIEKNQPELFHVKTVFYENLDKDFYEMERDQSLARRTLSMLISDYNKGAGSITKEKFIQKLKGIIATGKLSSDPEVQDVGDSAERQIYFVEQTEKTKADRKAHAAEIEADRKAKENYDALKAASDLAIKEKSLEDESLQKYLDLNVLKAKADKDVINYRIKDEKTKADLLLDIERQQLEAAVDIEYEYAKKHSALYAGMQSGFGTMWSEFIVGSRKAKNSWDAVWLSFRNSALNSIGSTISDKIMLQLFKGSAKSEGDKKEGSNLLDTIMGYVSYVIPFLADGAIVHKPTLAMIGEAGPEAVVPLDQINSTKVIYVQPVINGNFDVSMHKLNLKLDQNKKMMEELY